MTASLQGHSGRLVQARDAVQELESSFAGGQCSHGVAAAARGRRRLASNTRKVTDSTNDRAALVQSAESHVYSRDSNENSKSSYQFISYIAVLVDGKHRRDRQQLSARSIRIAVSHGVVFP